MVIRDFREEKIRSEEFKSELSWMTYWKMYRIPLLYGMV